MRFVTNNFLSFRLLYKNTYYTYYASPFIFLYLHTYTHRESDLKPVMSVGINAGCKISMNALFMLKEIIFKVDYIQMDGKRRLNINSSKKALYLIIYYLFLFNYILNYYLFNYILCSLFNYLYSQKYFRKTRKKFLGSFSSLRVYYS